MTPDTDPFAEFLVSLQALFAGASTFLQSIAVPGWRQNQVLIICAVIVVSWLLHKVVGGWVQNWVRARQGWSKWQLRVVVQVCRRLGLIWFAMLSGGIYVVMQNVTWPSRSYLIGLAATLAAVWVCIALITHCLLYTSPSPRD